MANNSTSMRFPFNLTGKVHPEVELAHRMMFNGLVDANQAIVELKSQITSLSSSSSSSSSSTTTASSSSSTTSATVTENVTQGSTVGSINAQTGTSYTLQTADYGDVIVLESSSAFALSLNSNVTSPFYVGVYNYGSGAVTLTPTSGTVNFTSSVSIPGGQTAIVYFDGSNWIAMAPVMAQTLSRVAHQWLDSYSALTGIFTQSQPAFSDLSGSVAASQLPAPTLSSLGGVEAVSATASNWINSISTSGVPQLSQPAIADISGLTAAIALLAPLASPKFTGTVTMPASVAYPDGSTQTSGYAGVGILLDVSFSGSATLAAAAWTVLSLPTVNTDTMSGWNSSTNSYTVPVSGIYMIVTKMRPADASTAYVSYGQGAGTSAADSPSFQWFMTVPTSGVEISSRNGSLNTRIMKLSKGDVITMFYYTDVAISIAAASMNITLLGTE